MKITFDEVLSKSTPIENELMQSLNTQVFATIDLQNNTREWDVKLVINGVEVEPVMYNLLFSHTEEWIEERAKEYLKDKLGEADAEVSRLLEYINQAKENIIEKFDL